MMKLLNCLIYLGIMGLLAFPFGRLLAHCKFDPDRFPFREYSWEDGGRIYEKLFKIKKWKDRVPDVSKMVPGIVPRKAMKMPGVEELNGMINETCVAELTHLVLIPLGIPILFIIQGWIGTVIFLVDIFMGNLPFAIIQRYNRFRYLKLRSKCESFDSKREHGNRT